MPISARGVGPFYAPITNMYPDRFGRGQLRTLQRRIKEWRQAMARGLVYGCEDNVEHQEKPKLVGAEEQT